MKPTLVLFSDFGLDSGFVASMHGVCKQVDPSLEVYDATHLLPPYNIRVASNCLEYTVPYWPAGTVIVCVVDPGVGTNRKASVAKLKNGTYIVTPDNGTLTLIDKQIGVAELREIDESVNRFPALEEVSVFHGRDLFSYCGARLAAGIITYEQVGPAYPLEEMVKHQLFKSEVRIGCAKGVIETWDPFGTLETNIRNTEFKKAGFVHGDKLSVTICLDSAQVFNGVMPYCQTFGDVKVGEYLLFNDLAFYVAIGLNERNFAKTYGMQEGKVYDILIEKAI